jgi:hypothetical protein
MPPRFYHHLPFINFVIATSAMTFQATMMYPRLNQVGKEVKEIKTAIENNKK